MSLSCINKTAMLFLFFFLSCSQRDRSNIFDPQNSNNSLNINFSIRQMSSGLELIWDLHEYAFVDSVIIYKKDNLTSVMQPIRVFSNTVSGFIDESVLPYEPVYYAISLKSNGMETPLSKTLMRIWADTDVFVLTYLGYAIYNLSFDLQEIKKTYNTNFQYYYFDIKNETIAISSPIYDQFSYIDFNDNIETLTKEIDGAGPLAFSRDLSSLFLTNLKKPYTLYKFNNRFSVIDSVTTIKRKPVEIINYESGKFVLVDSSGLIFFNENLTFTDSIYFSNGEINSVKYENGNLYAGLWLNNQNQTALMKINVEDYQYSELFKFPGDAFSVNGDTIWIEEREDQTKLVKLLQNGLRLLSSDDFSNITGIILHNETNYIYIIERYADVISLYDNFGNCLIKSNETGSTLYDPIKIKLINE